MTLSALCVVASLLAADAELEPAPVVERPGWSIGAGLSFAALRVGTDDGSAFRDIPNATLAVERRLAGRTWLLLGLRGGINEDKTSPEVEPVTMVSVVNSTTDQLVAVALGVRQSLLPVKAPVDVSVVAIASFGYQREVRSQITTRPMPLGPPVVENRTTVNNRGTAGLGLGITVERTLIENLAVRFTLGLMQVSYSAGRVANTNNAQSVSTLSAGLALQPGLELRFYF